MQSPSLPPPSRVHRRAWSMVVRAALLQLSARTSDRADTYCVLCTDVPRGASILIIRNPWIDLILDGHKTFEIRGRRCNKPEGERIYLALSGGGGVVLGAATFVACHGPLSRAEYASRADGHCVAGDTLPYSATYAWEVRSPERFRSPVAYSHKPGAVVWAKMA